MGRSNLPSGLGSVLPGVVNGFNWIGGATLGSLMSPSIFSSSVLVILPTR